MKKVLVSVFCLFLVTFLAVLSPYATRAGASTLCVDCSGVDPNCYQNIQEAIDVSGNGDVIIVKPGICYESINFLGSAVCVRSTDPNDPNVVASTIIDAVFEEDRVASFWGGEDPNSVLSGLTLRNGKDTAYGGGIYCNGSSPTIMLQEKKGIRENL